MAHARVLPNAPTTPNLTNISAQVAGSGTTFTDGVVQYRRHDPVRDADAGLYRVGDADGVVQGLAEFADVNPSAAQVLPLYRDDPNVANGVEQPSRP